MYDLHPPVAVISFRPSHKTGSPSTPSTTDPSASTTFPMHSPGGSLRRIVASTIRRDGPDLDRNRRAAIGHANHRRVTILD